MDMLKFMFDITKQVNEHGASSNNQFDFVSEDGEKLGTGSLPHVYHVVVNSVKPGNIVWVEKGGVRICGVRDNRKSVVFGEPELEAIPSER